MVLRRRRHAAELSQETLALESGVQRGFISLIETGQNQPTIGIILRTGWLRRWASSRRRWWRRLKDPLTVPHRRLPGEGNPPPTTLTQPVALERARSHGPSGFTSGLELG